MGAILINDYEFEHEKSTERDRVNAEILEYRHTINRYGLKRVWKEALEAIDLQVNDHQALDKMVDYLAGIYPKFGISYFVSIPLDGTFTFKHGFTYFDCESFAEGVAKAVLCSVFEQARWESLEEVKRG